MLGEETGRLCRHEVSGLPARSNRGLSIRQVDGANAMGVHRHGQMNRKTGFDSSDLERSFLVARQLAKHPQKTLAQDLHFKALFLYPRFNRELYCHYELEMAAQDGRARAVAWELRAIAAIPTRVGRLTSASRPALWGQRTYKSARTPGVQGSPSNFAHPMPPPTPCYRSLCRLHPR
jgi:hypothetical protein